MSVSCPSCNTELRVRLTSTDKNRAVKRSRAVDEEKIDGSTLAERNGGGGRRRGRKERRSSPREEEEEEKNDSHSVDKEKEEAEKKEGEDENKEDVKCGKKRRDEKKKKEKTPKPEKKTKKNKKLKIIESSAVWVARNLIVQHTGFWITVHGKHKATDDYKCERNSVMLDSKTKAYQLKLRVRHYLLSEQQMTQSDVDEQNLVPHIQIRKKNAMRTDFEYKAIQGAEYVIDRDAVFIGPDCIMLVLDHKRKIHYSLIYKDGISGRVDLLAVVVKVWNDMEDASPQSSAEYAALPNFGGDTNVLQYWSEPGSYQAQRITPPSDYVPRQVKWGIVPRLENLSLSLPSSSSSSSSSSPSPSLLSPSLSSS